MPVLGRMLSTHRSNYPYSHDPHNSYKVPKVGVPQVLCILARFVPVPPFRLFFLTGSRWIL